MENPIQIKVAGLKPEQDGGNQAFAPQDCIVFIKGQQIFCPTKCWVWSILEIISYWCSSIFLVIWCLSLTPNVLCLQMLSCTISQTEVDSCIDIGQHHHPVSAPPHLLTPNAFHEVSPQIVLVWKKSGCSSCWFYILLIIHFAFVLLLILYFARSPHIPIHWSHTCLERKSSVWEIWHKKSWKWNWSSAFHSKAFLKQLSKQEKISYRECSIRRRVVDVEVKAYNINIHCSARRVRPLETKDCPNRL